MENRPLISDTVDVVARDFLSLARELSSHGDFAQQVTVLSIEDEFSRFKVWAGNVAAHRRGGRSLEYRLRDAERLRLEVTTSLNELDDTIHDMLAIIKGEKIPWEMQQLDSDSDSDSVSSGSDLDPEYDSELKQLFASIKTSITGLLRLSMAIRNPAPTSQLESTINIDKSMYQEYDISHVQAKFPTCATFLVERLGRAISTRRQYLTYREEHHNKLTKGAEKLGLESSRTEHTANSTEATVQRQNSLNVIVEDDSMSQTSFATSVNAAIRVPPLPKEAEGQDFYECPLCFMIISVHTKHAWKQHVYRDLHPYCCTSEDCATAGRLFDSRHEWFNHELAHRRTWECIEGCGKTFRDLGSFEEHVQKKHSDLVELMPAMKSTLARGASLSSQVECPLCEKSLALKTYKKHMASHQQQLALFALPANLDETEDYDDKDEDEDELSVRDAESSEDEEASEALDIESPEASMDDLQQKEIEGETRGQVAERSLVFYQKSEGDAESSEDEEDFEAMDDLQQKEIEGETRDQVAERTLVRYQESEEDADAEYQKVVEFVDFLGGKRSTADETADKTSDGDRSAQDAASGQETDTKDKSDREVLKEEPENDWRRIVSGPHQTSSTAHEPVPNIAIYEAPGLDNDSSINVRTGQEEHEAKGESSFNTEGAEPSESALPILKPPRRIINTFEKEMERDRVERSLEDYRAELDKREIEGEKERKRIEEKERIIERHEKHLAGDQGETSLDDDRAEMFKGEIEIEEEHPFFTPENMIKMHREREENARRMEGEHEKLIAQLKKEGKGEEEEKKVHDAFNRMKAKEERKAIQELQEAIFGKSDLLEKRSFSAGMSEKEIEKEERGPEERKREFKFHKSDPTPRGSEGNQLRRLKKRPSQ